MNFERRSLINRWRKKSETAGGRAFPGNGTLRDEELVRLRKENASLHKERKILRKVVAIFSKPPR